jgi:MYXO-CTERM domain-containing protein
MALRFSAFALSLLIAAPAAAQTVDSVAPELLRRGNTTEIIVRGDTLEGTTGVMIEGGDVVISGLEVTETLIRFDVGVGATSTVGLRDLTLDGVDLFLEDALEVVPGSITLLSLDPVSGARGETIALAVRGSNLDTITGYDFGDGIEVTGWTSPSATSGTVTIEIEESAFSGSRAVSASRVDDDYTLFGGFNVTGGTPTFHDLLPPSGTRGDTVELRITGTNLDDVESITLGSRITIEDFSVTSPTVAIALVTVRQDAAAGPRAVTLRYDGGEEIVGDDAFNVRRGEIDVLQIRPDRLRQGDASFITIDGLNLDGATSVDAGEGVDVVAIDADFPTSISVDVEIDLGAPTGFRDVVITAPAGTFVVEDGLIIGEFVPPTLDVAIPPEADLGEVQIGTYGRGGVTVENRGELVETIQIIGIDGDVDLFALLDEAGVRTNRIEFELGVGERRDVIVEFTPDLRGRTGVEYQVTARGGEEVGSTIVRASGNRQQLLWGPAPPFDFGEHPANERVQLQRVDTDLEDGVPSRQTLVEGWELRIVRDGEPVTDDEFMTVDFQSTVGTGELFWGTTELLISVQGRPGTYAAIVPFYFFLTLTGEDLPDPEPGDDVPGPDVGSDVDPDASDVAADTPDANVDVTPDSGSDATPDTNTDSGTDTGGTDASADTGGGGGDQGCSSSNSAHQTPVAALFALLGLVGLRRRR